MFFFLDKWYLLLVLPAIVLTAVAQFYVQSTFKKFSKVGTRQNMTGAEASLTIQREHGIAIPVQPVAGKLTDHFDPSKNAIFLSEPVYASRSVAAVGIAAHETGHAVQYATHYVPMKIRAAIVPTTRFASMLAPILVILGLLLPVQYLIFAWIGILLFGVATVFQLVTLPVEFNASARALSALKSSGILDERELRDARRVLTAAALTYVAALFLSLMSLLRIVLLVSGRRR
ncbi:MAG: zinc metallopeptidase [Oscillospiraceae bacterium]|nr:zinc metallopeptidase [Oscillospiraceae bacterium]